MRGYEIVEINNRVWLGCVTHPHEGLWEGLVSRVDIIHWRYASPWGVMRIALPVHIGLGFLLRIPMRGYEKWFLCSSIWCAWVTHPHEGLWDKFVKKNSTECLGYASPWGVMSLTIHRWCNIDTELRIPMRGYEMIGGAPYLMSYLVTHPHEGLWVRV